MSEIKEDNKSELLYMRSNVNQDQSKIVKQLKIQAPKDIIPFSAMNQYFKQQGSASCISYTTDVKGLSPCKC